MGRLASYLQEEFERHCPVGWRVQREQAFMRAELSRLVGFSPRADLLLQSDDGSRRIWVELEVSRADPAANQVKFAAAHLFEPFAHSDYFVSMVSAHVAPGRRNLGAQAVLILRRLGLRAQQTALLPGIAGSEIKRINHLPLERIRQAPLDVSGELDRVFAVTEPLVEAEHGTLFLAGNVVEVRLNLLRWNLEMAEPSGRLRWGRRTITYFVYDPLAELFAPSKFCAYVMMNRSGNSTRSDFWPGGMDLQTYSSIPADAPLFDGGRARRHLVDGLGLQMTSSRNRGNLQVIFERWLRLVENHVTVHPDGPVVIHLRP